MAIKKYTVTEPYLETKCGLGEGPFWEESTNTLRFVDIVKQQIHVVDLTAGPTSHKVLAKLDISIGVTADIEGNGNGDFVFAGKHGFGIFRRAEGSYEYIKRVWTVEEVKDGREHRMRFNDGAVDTEGRFWAGAMNDPLVHEITNEGVLFRLDPDLSLHRVITSDVAIPNGGVWTADNSTFYLTESQVSSIFAYNFDAATGTISNRRVFYKPAEGSPDGHVLDEENHMWTAIYGGSKVLRISPAGEVVAEIELPTRCPTCPAFAGTELFVTSAAENEPEKYPGSAKYAGNVFKCDVGVRGLRPNKFRFAK
ncbi:hypothetical protein BDY21DRAFT_400268 [Lineolata rhizophorae]|uniref:SMP-30/Gluconolactonase/LRE-like region domain-containing protein n=1 Tax=Lineolata rhizophorae TaxID=578093 RepID=A0A6A6NR98_9PEZI|nr:hypothetical protein BDY21DRAFT_400268 [Lineolata rhizophorae]